jgi:hypothetical protein
MSARKNGQSRREPRCGKIRPKRGEIERRAAPVRYDVRRGDDGLDDWGLRLSGFSAECAQHESQHGKHDSVTR